MVDTDGREVFICPVGHTYRSRTWFKSFAHCNGCTKCWKAQQRESRERVCDSLKWRKMRDDALSVNLGVYFVDSKIVKIILAYTPYEELPEIPDAIDIRVDLPYCYAAVRCGLQVSEELLIKTVKRHILGEQHQMALKGLLAAKDRKVPIIPTLALDTDLMMAILCSSAPRNLVELFLPHFGPEVIHAIATRREFINSEVREIVSAYFTENIFEGYCNCGELLINHIAEIV